jgi:hypothetical protein
MVGAAKMVCGRVQTANAAAHLIDKALLAVLWAR